MFELNVDNAAAYLRERGWIGPGPVQIDHLGGGVSNLVLRVVTPERRFVLKQSRPQLRTKAAWFSDLNRIYREQEIMEALHSRLPPLTVPEVLFSDRANYVFAMSHAPPEARVWKEALLAGQIDLKIGERAGSVLGKMHQASAEDVAFANRFADLTIFEQLRIDPFYVTVQRNRPEVAELIEPIIQQLRLVKEALCHGDYTPKNILVHDNGFMLVDYETAHFGDPTMDLGLFLCHLALKSVRLSSQRGQFFELIRRFWQAYVSEVRFACPEALAVRGIAHFATCLLARIDGTSPVEYLAEEPRRELIRQVARWILQERPAQWEHVLDHLDQCLARSAIT